MEQIPHNPIEGVYSTGERRIPTTAIVVQTLQPDWLIELEIVAAA